MSSRADYQAVLKKLQLLVKMRDKLMRLASQSHAVLLQLEAEKQENLEKLAQIMGVDLTVQLKDHGLDAAYKTDHMPVSPFEFETDDDDNDNDDDASKKRKLKEGSAEASITEPRRRKRSKQKESRGIPKLVKPLPLDQDGNLILPVTVGKGGQTEAVIHSIGAIVHDRELYHSSRYIFPVGFKSTKQFYSLVDPAKKVEYTSEIIDNGAAPLFRVTAADQPGREFTGQSTSGAWKHVLDELGQMGLAGFKIHLSGPDLYGLSDLAVIKYVQEMPGASNCTRYLEQKLTVVE